MLHETRAKLTLITKLGKARILQNSLPTHGQEAKVGIMCTQGVGVWMLHEERTSSPCVDELYLSWLSSMGPLILPIISPLLCVCVCVCIYLSIYDVSICTKVIKRHGEGILATDGVWRLAKGVCNLQCLAIQISVALLTGSPLTSQHVSVPLHSN